MIEDYVAAVNAKLVERGAALDDGNCQICLLLGEEHDAENASAPRAIIFPTKDAFEAPWNPGGNQRPVKNVATGFELRIYGRSYGETETMRDQIVLAIHACGYGAYTLTGGAWDRTTLHLQQGRKYVMGLVVQAPIADVKLQTAKPNTGIHAEITMQFPAGDQGTVLIDVPIPNAT